MPKRKASTPPTKLGRLPRKLLAEATLLAWYERKTLPQLMQELVGDIISEKYLALPKAVRDRAKPTSASPAQSK